MDEDRKRYNQEYDQVLDALRDAIVPLVPKIDIFIIGWALLDFAVNVAYDNAPTIEQADEAILKYLGINKARRGITEAVA